MDLNFVFVFKVVGVGEVRFLKFFKDGSLFMYMYCFLYFIVMVVNGFVTSVNKGFCKL